MPKSYKNMHDVTCAIHVKFLLNIFQQAYSFLILNLQTKQQKWRIVKDLSTVGEVQYTLLKEEKL